eukprot:scaffold1147_cov172-Amphora_coffeaeformis.AAC.9
MKDEAKDATEPQSETEEHYDSSVVIQEIPLTKAYHAIKMDGSNEYVTQTPESNKSVRIQTPESEWEKFAEVDQCLELFNAYRACYRDKRRVVKRITVGSRGQENLRQPIPGYLAHNKVSFDPAQLQYLEKRAEATQNGMGRLINDLRCYMGKGVIKDSKIADLKDTGRVVSKCMNEYDGDVTRVLDFCRCCIVLPKRHARKAKNVVAAFHPTGPLGYEWQIRRIKDGFARAADGNFLQGGYCDIKLNLLCRKTKFIVELQIHLKIFHRIGEKSNGHKAYEFAREQSIRAPTNAAQLMERDCMDKNNDILEIGFKELQRTTGHKDRRKRAHIMARLGHLNLSEGRRTMAICWYMRALRSVYGLSYAAFLFRAGVSTVLCSCVAGQILMREDPKSRRKQRWTGTKVEKCLWSASFRHVLLRIKLVCAYTTKYLGLEHYLTLRAKAAKAELTMAIHPDQTPYAMVCFEEALIQQIKVFGESHPEVCETYGTIGLSCLSLFLHGETKHRKEHMLQYSVENLVKAWTNAKKELHSTKNYVTRRHLYYLDKWLPELKLDKSNPPESDELEKILRGALEEKIVVSCARVSKPSSSG